ncbi:MAG TPA: alpha/beta fold hydrolase [Geminicoccaceae bacterium]|nr:alpha/beta fold hydrolase [Geminicoccus sp.]HMU51214.1 alpha/beta fold hydrolase [Geminicoccaceae bacterium]
MMRLVWICVLSILAGLVSPAPAGATFVGPYDYPFVNPLVATVVGTPPANEADLPAIERVRNVRQLELDPFPGRTPPPVFWYAGKLRSGLFFLDREPRPLAVVIGGTGAGFAATKSIVLARTMLKAGYHVLTLANPTNPNFIVAASGSHIPARLTDDAEDLYRVVEQGIAEVKRFVPLTGDVVLTGYSLGAVHAAYLAKLDDEKKRIGFKKTMMLNPPVSLYTSLGILDDLVDRHLKTDPASLRAFLDRLFERFADFYATAEDVDLTADFLFRAYLELQPQDEELEQLIGIVFRLTANDLAFTSDVMTNAGYVVPKDARLTQTTSLTAFFTAGMGLSFNEFFTDVYYPFFRVREPRLNAQQMVERESLYAIADWLRANPNIAVITNEDDIILGPGQVDFLVQTFGDRATIFPTGGHCGNMSQRDYVAKVVEFFAP